MHSYLLQESWTSARNASTQLLSTVDHSSSVCAPQTGLLPVRFFDCPFMVDVTCFNPFDASTRASLMQACSLLQAYYVHACAVCVHAGMGVVP